MKLKLLILLLITTLSLQSEPFTLVCKPGILQRDNKRYILQCECNSNEICEFNLDIPQGWYYYYNETDTSILVVQHNDVYEYSKHFYDWNLIIR